MRPGGVLDEALEGRCQRARDCRRSPRARASDQALAPLAGKTMAPLAESGRGTGEGGRDGVQTLSFHDVAPGLGTAADAGCFGLLYEGVEGRECVIGKVACEGPHLRVSTNNRLQKYDNPPLHNMVTLLSAHNLSASNFPGSAQCRTLNKKPRRRVVVIGARGTTRLPEPGKFRHEFSGP
jgi:hypothetical protein